MTIDLNCDMGEGMPHDGAIMPYISSANIACGYHAGDETTIRKTIDLCLRYNVAVGAHPGFDDKPNFGRVPVRLSEGELYQLVRKQLEIIQNICEEKGAELHHVKPHGALYNMAATDRSLSRVLTRAVYDFSPNLIYYGLSGSVMISEAQAVGLKTANEVFADRTYMPDGTLTPRTHPQALIVKVEDVVRQVVQLVTENQVTTCTGETISMKADTVCIHGDGPHAVEFLQAIHKRLRGKSIGS
jgi:UPF0271 protein